MEEELSYPYRRFSSDIYAEGLIVLLEENHIPFEVVVEPEGVGSVFLGSAAMPGVIVMVRPADALRVKSLEKTDVPDKISQIVSEENKEFDTVAPWWIVCGYVMVIVFSPISLILGLHLMNAKRRQPNMSYAPAYDLSTRRHGNFIFWGGMIFLGFGIYQLAMIGYRGSLWQATSYVLRRFTKY